jgi:hypothetical protein
MPSMRISRGMRLRLTSSVTPYRGLRHYDVTALMALINEDHIGSVSFRIQILR